MKASDRQIPLILIALIVSVSPHIGRMPLWASGWCMLLWAYIFQAFRHGWYWPGRTMRIALAIAGFGGVVLTFGLRMGGNAYISLLAITSTLKILEIKSYRDEIVSIFLIYFIVITGLFNSESLAIILYMFGAVLLTTSVLIRINHPESSMKSDLRLASVIMLQALPLMIILFILFPRIRGSVWGFTKGGTGRSGFSDTISPGSVTSLIRSNELVFRAEFSGKIPDSHQLYWRGIVFHEFDGKSWQIASAPIPMRLRKLSGTDEAEYTITLEPHEQRWLFALDLPNEGMRDARLLDDYTLRSFREIRQKIRYPLKSYTNYNTEKMRRWESADTELPDDGNPQARKLAQQWSESIGNPEKIVAQALEFFKENRFVYTLNPPFSGNHIIDEFLFKTRKGYCEHYASAFAFLMRAAGIPARVVGGYLGGEVNPYGNYLIVRQSDAHAWSEVWLEDRGWVRVDPTSVVAPERIEQGLAAALSPEELPPFLLSRGPLSDIWKKIRFGWDSVNNQWNIWFMGYSFEHQKLLLQIVGIRADAWYARFRLVMIAAGFIGAFVIIMTAWFLKKSFIRKDIVTETYDKFCRKLAKIGFSRIPSQGPADYAAMVIHHRRDLEKIVFEITELYILLRYRSDKDKVPMKKFRSLVAGFKPDSLSENSV